jgi:hypothetical protein
VRDKNMMLYKKVWRGKKENKRGTAGKKEKSFFKSLEKIGSRRPIDLPPPPMLPIAPLSFQHDRVHFHYIITIQNGVSLFTDHQSGMIAYKCLTTTNYS